LPGTNALAYCENSQLTVLKSFATPATDRSRRPTAGNRRRRITDATDAAFTATETEPETETQRGSPTGRGGRRTSRCSAGQTLSYSQMKLGNCDILSGTNYLVSSETKQKE
jgi:hypothetical protein